MCAVLVRSASHATERNKSHCYLPSVTLLIGSAITIAGPYVVFDVKTQTVANSFPLASLNTTNRFINLLTLTINSFNK